MGDGPGVFVIDGVDVGVDVGPPVAVGVGVFDVDRLKTSWQLTVFNALGVTCGTVGATACLFSSCVEVR